MNPFGEKGKIVDNGIAEKLVINPQLLSLDAYAKRFEQITDYMTFCKTIISF